MSVSPRTLNFEVNVSQTHIMNQFLTPMLRDSFYLIARVNIIIKEYFTIDNTNESIYIKKKMLINSLFPHYKGSTTLAINYL